MHSKLDVLNISLFLQLSANSTHLLVSISAMPIHDSCLNKNPSNIYFFDFYQSDLYVQCLFNCIYVLHMIFLLSFHFHPSHAFQRQKKTLILQQSYSAFHCMRFMKYLYNEMIS